MILDTVSEIANQFKLYQPSIPFYYTKNALNQELPDERVIWYPISDEFTPTQHIGKNPLQIYSREFTMEFHIYSRDLNRIDNFLNWLLVSIYEKVFEPQVVDISGQYVDAGQNLQQGFAYILSVTISGIIIKKPLREAEITTVESHSHFNNSPEYVPPLPP